jgi:hypothetical protein
MSKGGDRTDIGSLDLPDTAQQVYAVAPTQLQKKRPDLVFSAAQPLLSSTDRKAQALHSGYTHTVLPSPLLPPASPSNNLLVLRRSSTSNNLHQLARNNSLTRAIVQNLELANHVASVLGGVVHGVAAGGLFAGVAFGEGPEEGVGEGVFAEVAEDLVVDFEGGEVCCVLLETG